MNLFACFLEGEGQDSMEGNMRRLPPWMIASASSGVTEASNRDDNKIIEGKIKHEAEAPKTKKKRKTRREIEEPKKVEIRRRKGGGGVGKKIKEEESKPSVDHVNRPEIIESVTSPEDDVDLTVDDLLSFAHEYVKGEEEDQASLSTSDSMEVGFTDESNTRLSQRETNGTTDPTSEDMINLLLGPFFKKSGNN